MPPTDRVSTGNAAAPPRACSSSWDAPARRGEVLIRESPSSPATAKTRVSATSSRSTSRMSGCVAPGKARLAHPRVSSSAGCLVPRIDAQRALFVLISTLFVHLLDDAIEEVCTLPGSAGAPTAPPSRMPSSRDAPARRGEVLIGASVRLASCLSRFVLCWRALPRILIRPGGAARPVSLAQKLAQSASSSRSTSSCPVCVAPREEETQRPEQPEQLVHALGHLVLDVLAVVHAHGRQVRERALDGPAPGGDVDTVGERHQDGEVAGVRVGLSAHRLVDQELAANPAVVDVDRGDLERAIRSPRAPDA